MSYYEAGGLRPFDQVEQSELAKLYRARTIKDPAKLAALVPACNRPWSFPTRHAPSRKGSAAEFSFAELRHVPGAPAKLPNLTTSHAAPKSRIPGYMTVAEGVNVTLDYIRRFEELNNLKPAPITLVRCFEPADMVTA